MFRSALISLACLATPASAYDVDARMAAAWSSFQTLCFEALFAPQEFIDATRNPGPAGVATIARSADGKMLEARRFSDTQMVTFRVTGMETLRLLTCSVHDQGFNAAEIDMRLTQNFGPWLAAFEAVVLPSAPQDILSRIIIEPLNMVFTAERMERPE